MRRLALLCCVVTTSGLLTGCTGMGVFFDHTHVTWFGENPNAPAGSSEMFMRLRGEQVAITPLVPEVGNVWPGPAKPDPTLQELEQQQQQGGGVAPAVVGGGTGHQQPRPAGNPAAQPNGTTPVVPPRDAQRGAGQNGTTVDTTGGTSLPNYRGLQQPLASPGAGSGKGILVPNGNGTSTLIAPDGSVTTVPTKP